MGIVFQLLKAKREISDPAYWRRFGNPGPLVTPRIPKKKKAKRVFDDSGLREEDKVKYALERREDEAKRKEEKARILQENQERRQRYQEEISEMQRSHQEEQRRKQEEERRMTEVQAVGEVGQDDPESMYENLDWDRMRTGEPMIVKSPRLRYIRELAEENLRNILANPESDPAEKFYYRYGKDDPRATLSARDKRKGVLLGASGRQYETPEHREAIEGGEVDEQGVFLRKPFGGFYTPPKPPVNPNVDEPYDEMYNEYYNVSTGEPMDIAFQLLKERKSPEAMRRKLEYDKQYEKTPERRKYQRELHAERRKRGIYGTGDHMDVSHTQGGRLTLEPEHANRARHFKDRGTLRVV